MAEFIRHSYSSLVDGREDWYLFRAGHHPVGIVYLHGHGSHGDQPVTWQVCNGLLAFWESLDADVLSPNLRDNAWMCPEAAADLECLLKKYKSERHWQKIVIVAGSMGGTGALIFSMLHPELIDGVGALGAATSLKRYYDWCTVQDGRAPLPDICKAIDENYTKEELSLHDVCRHAEKLTMPIYYWHGGSDPTIPVQEAKALAERLRECRNFHFEVVPGGDHDSPLMYFSIATKLLLHDLGYETACDPTPCFDSIAEYLKNR